MTQSKREEMEVGPSQLQKTGQHTTLCNKKLLVLGTKIKSQQRKVATMDLLADDAKNHQVEDLVSPDGRSRGVSCLWSKPARKLEKEVQYTGVVFAKNTPMLKSERRRMM